MGIRTIGNRAIHLIPIIESLSDTADNFLVVSDRSLYILNNVIALDAIDQARYALELLAYGRFQSLETDDEEYEVYDDATDRLQVELIPMSLDWQTWSDPTLFQGTTEVQIAPSIAQYIKLGTLAFVQYAVTVTQDSTFTARINIRGQPADIIAHTTQTVLGSAIVRRNTDNIYYQGSVIRIADTTWRIVTSGQTSELGNTPSFLLKANDVVSFQCVYKTQG